MCCRFASARKIVLCAVWLGACEPEGSVTLSARIASPTLDVEATALTTELDGGFELVLELGEYAPDPTTVELGVLTIRRDAEVLASGFDFDTTPGFPLTVDVGQTQRVEFVVRDGVAMPELAALLCQADLSFSTTLSDSLGDHRPHTVTSGDFAPRCR